jgi:integrase
MAHSNKAANSRKRQSTGAELVDVLDRQAEAFPVVKVTTRKPAKKARRPRAKGVPHPDFPLSPRKDGRWAKKVKGKVFIFAGTADEAAKEWDRCKDYIFAHGRLPPPENDGAFTVEDACDIFLNAKKPLVTSGEITQWTYNEYFKTCERIIKQFGKSMHVESLRPDDFAKLRESIAKQWGVVRLGNEVQRVRSIFKFAFDDGKISRPVLFGTTFKKPTRKALRIERAKKGLRMFESAEIRTLLASSGVQMKAMTLLAVNCGFGNADLGNLPLAALDLKSGWVNFPRPKTGIPRRCPLWKETVAAIEAAIKDRTDPKDPAHAALVFVTKYGQPWFKETTDNPVSKEFRKLLDELDMHRAGLGFYSLRHTFETIGGAARDQVAVNAIMGHVDASMSAHYRERIDDDRLQAVVDHVHRWLFPPEAKTAKKAAAKKGGAK